MVLADKVVCMNHGRIEQIGTPESLYQQPRTRFVAEFMGQSNLLPQDWLAQAEPALAATAPAELGTTALACVRPEALSVEAAAEGAARVLDQLFLGNLKRLRLDWLGRTVLAEVPAHSALKPGDAARVAIAPHACAWIAP